METQQQTKPAAHRLARQVVTKYSCGCTTTLIESERGQRLDAPACSGHGGVPVRREETIMLVEATNVDAAVSVGRLALSRRNF